ncbi:ribosome maturation factor RimP [Pelagirhabdus alkalitolerans]|uniref:Ribosome maturation factor RimP n=1 Tax=Pelagirhabdus alkalitolerans TaxID=1612202 RepID=A0A1G6H401_9BACI|nr:ribosome maturation factor RimP [Pelagirhabdus alkalitolerans]SDB89020.1 ribosome maturation factor RimP [Pelagirhabdus alkalitolerans]
MSSNVIEETEKLVKPILDSMELELVETEFKKEGKDWFLRVFIDKPGGVDIEECGRVSEQLSEALDSLDPIDVAYYLEVSSPGAERPLKKLKDVKNHIGHQVHVKLYEPLDGQKEYEGELITVDEEDVVVIEIKEKAKKKQIEIPFKKIAKARLAVSFN